jgi:hypothetical protein
VPPWIGDFAFRRGEVRGCAARGITTHPWRLVPVSLIQGATRHRTRRGKGVCQSHLLTLRAALPSLAAYPRARPTATRKTAGATSPPPPQTPRTPPRRPCSRGPRALQNDPRAQRQRLGGLTPTLNGEPATEQHDADRRAHHRRALNTHLLLGLAVLLLALAGAGTLLVAATRLAQQTRRALGARKRRVLGRHRDRSHTAALTAPGTSDPTRRTPSGTPHRTPISTRSIRRQRVRQRRAEPRHVAAKQPRGAASARDA